MSLYGSGLFNWLPDKPYLSMVYRTAIGKRMNWNNPQTYNEKLQWLKLYDRKPIYVSMVDKYLAREFVKSQIGEEYLIPLIGVWDNANDIDFSSLPNKFVLKCNHDSGSIIICTD